MKSTDSSGSYKVVTCIGDVRKVGHGKVKWYDDVKKYKYIFEKLLKANKSFKSKHNE